jgi:hypothetical protein
MYTLLVGKEGQIVMVKALEKYSQMHLGQTPDEMSLAKNLTANISRAQGTTIDLSTITSSNKY